MKLWLQQLSAAKGATEEICLDRFPFIIGRRSDSHCCLPFAFISRHHCQFTCNGDEVLVQDLESYNGTFVNGRDARQPLPVQDGDEITLGPLTFRVVMPRAAHETADLCRTPTQTDLSTFGGSGGGQP
jgi:pSer/pThr/pTyr-binding forkhead associated (FHA) protein